MEQGILRSKNVERALSTPGGLVKFKPFPPQIKLHSPYTAGKVLARLTAQSARVIIYICALHHFVQMGFYQKPSVFGPTRFIPTFKFSSKAENRNA